MGSRKFAGSHGQDDPGLEASRKATSPRGPAAMRLPSFFSRGGGGRGGGARALRAIRRPPMLQQTQASASADHVRRKTERAKRREESGSWKDPEALGHVRSRFPHWIGLFCAFSPWLTPAPAPCASGCHLRARQPGGPAAPHRHEVGALHAAFLRCALGRRPQASAPACGLRVAHVQRGRGALVVTREGAARAAAAADAPALSARGAKC
jgi:hypothetical protein